MRLLTEPESPALPQRRDAARHARGRDRAVGVGHADRPEAGREAGRDRRVRPEIPLAEHLLVLRYTDRPGVIGASAGCSATPGVNIAAMQVGRTPRSAAR